MTHDNLNTDKAAAQVVSKAVEQSFKTDWAQSVGYMLRVCGDVAVAEECVQAAYEAGLKNWKTQIPDNTGAWIRKTARNRFIDMTRAHKTHSQTHSTLKDANNDNDMLGEGEEPSILDDELSLMFLCCHPAISSTDQVILVLRLIGGLKPIEIGSAFQSHEDAIRSRLLRAKRKMTAAKISTTMPPPEDIANRTQQVLAAIYLIYNEGYRASRDATTERQDLVLEAIRLAARFCRYMPEFAEAHGLMALILLNEARRPARFSKGALIPLEAQDRTLWDNDLINAGLMHVQKANGLNTAQQSKSGIYLMQAVIAALHSTIDDFEHTNWTEISNIYDQILTLQPSSMFELNRIAAASYQERAIQSQKALDLWEENHQTSAQSQALRADIYRRNNQSQKAKTSYQSAIALETDEGVVRFLQNRINRLDV